MVGLAPGETPLRVVAWADPESPLLDLLRVGYVIGEVHEKLELPKEVRLLAGERRTLRLFPNRACHEIRFRSVMTGGWNIRQDTQVGRVILRDASGDELTGRVYESFKASMARTSRWGEISERAFTRARALGNL